MADEESVRPRVRAEDRARAARPATPFWWAVAGVWGAIIGRVGETGLFLLIVGVWWAVRLVGGGVVGRRYYVRAAPVMLLLVGVPLLVSPHLASGHAYWLGVLALAASTVVVPVLLPGDHPGSGGPPPTPSRRVLPHDPDSLRRLHAELEEQKRRLGQELHDELGQLLTGLHYHVETLEAAWTEKGLPPLESLDATKRILDRGLQELHRIVLDLRPQILDDFGLAPALRWCAREYLENTGIAVRLRLEPMERLTTERETALFRIAQEAFTNILRHARAGHVSVALWETEDSLVHLRIRDDGGGFDTSGPSDGASRVGLRSMYERARLLGGSCTVVSDKDRGAELIAVIPR